MKIQEKSLLLVLSLPWSTHSDMLRDQKSNHCIQVTSVLAHKSLVIDAVLLPSGRHRANQRL